VFYNVRDKALRNNGLRLYNKRSCGKGENTTQRKGLSTALPRVDMGNPGLDPKTMLFPLTIYAFPQKPLSPDVGFTAYKNWAFLPFLMC